MINFKGFISRHIKDNHEQQAKFECDKCRLQFTRLDNMKQHKIKRCRSDPLLFPIPCSENCGGNFKTLKQMKAHLKQCRTRQNPIQDDLQATGGERDEGEEVTDVAEVTGDVEEEAGEEVEMVVGVLEQDNSVQIEEEVAEEALDDAVETEFHEPANSLDTHVNSYLVDLIDDGDVNGAIDAFDIIDAEVILDSVTSHDDDVIDMEDINAFILKFGNP